MSQETLDDLENQAEEAIGEENTKKIKKKGKKLLKNLFGELRGALSVSAITQFREFYARLITASAEVQNERIARAFARRLARSFCRRGRGKSGSGRLYRDADG